MDILKSIKEEPHAAEVPSQTYGADGYSSETSGLMGWIITHSGGAVKNEKQASILLLVFSAVMIIVALFLVFRGGGPELPSQEEIDRATPRPPLEPQ